MFGAFLKLADNIKKLNTRQLSVSVFALPEIKQFVIRLNRFEQLYSEGIDVNDKIIGIYSHFSGRDEGESYIFNGVVSTKKPGEHYTLFDTGVFFASFSVRVDKDGFVIVANTEKVDGDILRYGEILGLTNKSKSELSKKMLPFLRKAIREAILHKVL